jgi:hypothetical protein
MTPKEMAFTIGNGLLSFRVAGLDLPRVARLSIEFLFCLLRESGMHILFKELRMSGITTGNDK